MSKFPFPKLMTDIALRPTFRTTRLKHRFTTR